MSVRFGIDLDGVLGNFTASVVKVANSIWSYKLPYGYVPNNWGYTDVFTKEDWDQIWTAIKETENFWLEEEPIVNNVDALFKYIVTDGYDSEIYFITSRVETVGESVLVQSSYWLEKHELFPNAYSSTVIPVADAKHKAAMCAGLRISFMLDDYAPTVEQLQKVDGLRAFVLDQPWNRDAKDLPRVYSVAEYLEIIKEG